jgi:ParB family chromosome partitioning protein
MAKRGLGRGLSALIPTVGAKEQVETPKEAEQKQPEAVTPAETGGLNLKQIDVDHISPNPNQPRKKISESALNELIASIKEVGIVQPIVVRASGTGYELVVGERRWRAAKKAGLKTIPAIIRTSTNTESLEMAVIENIQRENLNAIEEALAYRQLLDDFNINQNDIAQRVGKDRATIANTLRLLQLPPEIQRMVVSVEITSGHARSLLALQGDSFQAKLARRICREDLSVRQVEDIIRRWRKGITSDKPHHKPLQPKGLVSLAEKLTEYLETPVKVHVGRKKGKIEVEFSTVDDLERIYDTITKGA